MCLILCSLGLTAEAQNSVTQQVIVQVDRCIRQKAYVAGYHQLLLHKDAFTEEHEKFFYHLYLAKVLQRAVRESEAPMFSDDYIEALRYVSDYFLKHRYVHTSYDMQICWQYLVRLSDVYLVSRNTALETLFERVREVYRTSEVKDDEAYFHIQMNHYVQLMQARNWGLASLAAQGLANQLAEAKADDTLIQEASYYAALGECIQLRSQSTLQTLHQVSKGRTPQHAQGTEAWKLYLQSLSDELHHHTASARAKMEQAYAALPASHGLDRYQRLLVEARYESMYTHYAFGAPADSHPKSLLFYENQLHLVQTSTLSNADKLHLLLKNELELTSLQPLPVDLYLRYVQQTVALKKLLPTNDEVVALPSDYAAVKQTKGSTAFDQLMGENEKGLIKYELLAALQVLSKSAQKDLAREADLWHQLGEVLADEKHYTEALPAFEQALLKRGTDPTKTMDQLHTLALMARCCQKTGDSLQCKRLLQTITTTQEQIDTKYRRTVGYVSMLNYVADVYVTQGNKEQARSYSDKAIHYAQNSFRLMNECNKASYRKALLLYADGHYRACADLLLQVCPVDRDVIHFELFYGILIKSLCQVDDARAIACYKEFTRRSMDEIIPTFLAGKSQFSRDVLWAYKSSALMQLGAEVAYHFPRKDVISLAFDNTVFCKSLDLRMNMSLRDFVNQSDDVFIQSLYKEMLSAQDSLHYAEPSKRMQFKNHVSFAQEQLLSMMVDQRKKNLAQTPYTELFRQRLGKSMALIEYAVFTLNNEKHYCAYVMRKGEEAPAFYPLCSEKELKACLGDGSASGIDRVYTTEALAKCVWTPMAHALDTTSVKSLIMVPTGLLNRVNLYFMPVGNSRLTDCYQVLRITTSASLMDGRKFRFKLFDTDVAMFGNMRYAMTDAELESAAEKYPSTSEAHPHLSGKDIHRSADESTTLSSLPFTAVELNEVEQVFKQTSMRISRFTGKEATEEAFKQFDGKAPLYFHIATHGFYLKDKAKKEKHSFYNDLTNLYYPDKPLLYSGLLMAGAQKAWSGEEIPAHVEDGILTADEISRMDLSRTLLVVLSACETALGDMDETAGVVGLQRAFKKAGVDWIVMSLWKVRDDVATLFMKEFYHSLSQQKLVDQAMREAAYAVKKIYPSPKDWAAFIIQR